MIYYLFFFCGSGLFFKLALKAQTPKNHLYFKIFVFCSALLLIFLSGFRDLTVGTDSTNYMRIYESTLDFQSLVKKWDVHGEYGFFLLNYLGNFVSNNFAVIFTINATIVVFCYYNGIINSSKYPFTSFILFLVAGPYLFHFNGARQGLALAVYFISFRYIIRKEFFKYLSCILIGALFHKSILLTIPLYYLFATKLSLKKFIALTLGFMILAVSFDSFISIATDIDARYKTYGDRNKEVGGAITSIFNISLFFWFVFSRKLNRIEDRLYDVCLSMYFVGVLISLMSLVLQLNPSGFLRMGIYFTQMVVFLLPISIFSIKHEGQKVAAFIMTSIFILLYFYLTINAFSNLVPYSFNPYISAFNSN